MCKKKIQQKNMKWNSLYILYNIAFIKMFGNQWTISVAVPYFLICLYIDANPKSVDWNTRFQLESWEPISYGSA